MQKEKQIQRLEVRNLKLFRALKKHFNLSFSFDENYSEKQQLDEAFNEFIYKELDTRIRNSDYGNQCRIIEEYSEELKLSISSFYKGSLRCLGISAKSLDRKYRYWKTLSELGESDFFRYSSLIKEKSNTIKRLALNGDVIRYFFKYYKGGLESWCEKNKISENYIKGLLFRRRVYKNFESNLLKKDIDLMINSLNKERKICQKEIISFNKKLMEIEQKLANLNALKLNKSSK